MAKRKRTTKPVYQQITSKLGQLTREELDELIEVATVLRETMDKTPEEMHEEFVEQHKKVFKVSGEDTEQVKRPKRGHVEEKMINSCGPYLYLRHWRGGKLREALKAKAGSRKGNCAIPVFLRKRLTLFRVSLFLKGSVYQLCISY